MKKAKPVQLKGDCSFASMLAEVQKEAEEFAKLSPEEQERRRKAGEEALAKLRGTPGFMEIKLK